MKNIAVSVNLRRTWHP